MFNYVMTITSLLSENLGATIFIAFIGFLIGIVIMYILSKLGYNKVKQEAVTLLENSKQQAETTIREAVLEGKTAVYELRLSAENCKDYILSKPRFIWYNILAEKYGVM